MAVITKCEHLLDLLELDSHELFGLPLDSIVYEVREFLHIDVEHVEPGDFFVDAAFDFVEEVELGFVFSQRLHNSREIK